MSHDFYPDATIQRILKSVRTIAIVGASNNNARPSYFVLKYLLSRGYRVFPINPGLAGKDISGAPVYARLADIPEPVDMVEIFRNSAAASGIVDDALKLRGVDAQTFFPSPQRRLARFARRRFMQHA